MGNSVNHVNGVHRNGSALFALLDFTLISVSFFLVNYVKRGTFLISEDYVFLLLSFYSAWWISSLLAKKYPLTRPDSLKQGLHPFYRAFVYMLVLLLFSIFILKLFQYSRFIILASLLVYLILEVAAYTIFYLAKWGPNVGVIYEDYSRIERMVEKESEEEIQLDNNGRKVKESLKSKYNDDFMNSYKISKDCSTLFDFLNSAINLNRINASDSFLLDAKKSEVVDSIINQGLEFIGNLHMLNDIDRINKFFISVNQGLTLGGYFAGVVETFEQRLKRQIQKYPRLGNKFIYLLDYLWTRIFPKLPALKKIYFMIHGRDRRIISKSEVLGRLYYCGFELVKMEEIDKKFYFLVKRVRAPLEDKNPSYGPIFKQRRIGENGQPIYTYKFRTMHPYSEYIHKYVLENNGMDSNGKIKNDIRIPHWGRIMRKYWLDELPMLINFLQGDLRLIGLRPVSESYFKLCPKDLKKERVEVQPGLIPAIYADMPKSLEDVWDSERKFLKERKKHPVKTEFIYFSKIVKNIVLKGMRSS